jgi:hypothetical protein
LTWNHGAVKAVAVPQIDRGEEKETPVALKLRLTDPRDFPKKELKNKALKKARQICRASSCRANP